MQNVQDKTVSRYLCKFADSPSDTTNLEHSAIELLQFFLTMTLEQLTSHPLRQD
jgi:hypothetical protein